MRRILSMGSVLLLASGCVVREVRQAPPVVVYREPPPAPPPPVYAPPPPPPAAPVVAQDPEWESVSIEPAFDQPAPVAIPWAPPPMLWDPPPPRPWFDAVWVGGHWTWWNGEWVWARGYWARAPRAGWVYAEPYYEYRGNVVVFVAGFWRPVTRVFIPPPPTVYIPVVQVRVVHVGYARPNGPHGVFVPPPPGSQPGVIVPCPVGTSPAVVLSAPPVVRPGMVVRPVSRAGVVEVVAPAGVTREGRPVSAQAPVVAHDAASVHPVVVAPAPPIRNPGRRVNEPVPFPSQNPPATVGGEPVTRPVPAPSSAPGQSGTSTVTVRPVPPPPNSLPPVQPVLRPESMGGERGNPRPWSNGDDRQGNEPILKPVPRAESMGGDRGKPRPWSNGGDRNGNDGSRPDATPRPPPVQSAPPAARPSAPAAAPRESEQATPPVANRAEPAPKRQAPPKVDPQDRKGSRDSYER
ncbi:MAG TPA: hypothetical protein VFN45_03540 [Myxococcaceae bacterium]|nr:hypothetical protein [Myxococcaceae bacterium]